MISPFRSAGFQFLSLVNVRNHEIPEEAACTSAYRASGTWKSTASG